MYRSTSGNGDFRNGVWLADLADNRQEEPEFQVFTELGTSSIRSALLVGENLWAMTESAGGDTRLVKHRRGYGRKWLAVSVPHLFSLDMQHPDAAWINEQEDQIVWAEEKDGGYGGLDLWMAQRSADSWGPAVNLGPAINGAGNEGAPTVSPDGGELWYTGVSRRGQGTAIFRSKPLQSGNWGEPQEVLSGNCSDPSVDAEGNLYFVASLHGQRGPTHPLRHLRGSAPSLSLPAMGPCPPGETLMDYRNLLHPA